MADLKHPALMYLKAGLLIGIGTMSCWLIWIDRPTWRVAALLALAVWAFARAYYFAFYVVEHYVDPGYRYSGLGSFAGYLISGKKKTADVDVGGHSDRQDAPRTRGG